MGAMYPMWERLPTQYNAAIGRIVTRQAILEDNLHKIICGLLEVSLVYGRIAVPMPRVADAITRVEDLMQLRGFSTTLNMKEFKTDCRGLEEFRDKISHGGWAKFPGHKWPVLQITTGKNSDGSKARISPKAGIITLAVMKSYVRGLDEAIKDARILGKELAKQHAALRDKRTVQSRRS